jgi:HK97 family phage prohead protease
MKVAMKSLVSLDEFRAAAREDHALKATVQRLATGDATEVEGKSRTLRFCFSDGSVDRAGDRIDPKGWELDAFNKNPVALWAHDSWSPPIGRASGVGPIGKRLMGDIEFAGAEIYPFADTIYLLSKGGFINAVSVGFNPLEWTFVNDADRPYGIDFKRQELLEISVCPVPCNSNALAEARSKGIDTRPIVEWAEKVLDLGGSAPIAKIELEALRKQASDKPGVRYYLTGGKSLTASQAATIKGQFDDWLAGGATNLLILEGGLELKSIGKDDAAPTCSRAKDKDCGMLDPAECAIHRDMTEAEKAAAIHKAGRRISASNIDALNKAMDHIKSVVESNASAEEDDPATDPAETPAAETEPVVIEDESKSALRESAKATLAAARAI